MYYQFISSIDSVKHTFYQIYLTKLETVLKNMKELYIQTATRFEYRNE